MRTSVRVGLAGARSGDRMTIYLRINIMSTKQSGCLIMLSDSKDKRVSSLSGNRTHHTIPTLSSTSFNL